jgi:hypothetical protein
MYAMTKDDAVYVLGGSIGGAATPEVWKSAPGRVDFVGFGELSMPTVKPELRMVFPEVGSTFTVVDAEAGLELHAETLRLFEVYFVFSEEMIAGEGDVRIGDRVVCRPKFGTCIDKKSTVYPIPPMEFAKVTPKSGYLAVVVDTYFAEAGELLIDIDDDALQDLYGNRVAVSLNATYMVVKDANPAEVDVSASGGLLPAADATGVDLAVLHIPFTKPVNLAANASTPLLTLTPVPNFKSSVTYESGADLVQLTDSALEARWPAAIETLSPGATYEVNLSGVVDTMGLLMKPASWRFTVRAGWYERLGKSYPEPLKYNFEELQGYVSESVMLQVLSARILAQRIQQDAQVYDIGYNVSVIEEKATLEASNPDLASQKTTQQGVTDGLTAQLDSDCQFPTTYTDGGVTKSYNMYPPFPFPMTIEADHSFEVTSTQEVMNETLGYAVMIEVQETITTQLNVSCLCYARDDADFVQWISYVYSWFNFISCRDAEYYTGCAGIMPTVSSSCSTLLDDYEASVAAYAALEEQYTTDSARLTTVEALIDRYSYDGGEGPVFSAGWPDNGATDVGGDNWDIILKWDEDVDLNATGEITVRSSTNGVVAVFDVSSSPYVIKTPPTGLSEYWITIFMTNASAQGALTLPTGGLSALGTVSVEVPEGVVVDNSQKYRPSKGIAPGEYSFTVLPLDLDTSVPTVIATSPAAEALVPDSLSVISLQLSEPVTVADGLTASLVCTGNCGQNSDTTIAPAPPLGPNGTTTFLDFPMPLGLLTSVPGMVQWTFSVPVSFATDGAVTPNPADAFSFNFNVSRPAATGVANVIFESVAPPSASVILGFSEPLRPGVGSLLLEAVHAHNSLDMNITDAARPVVENGMYGYRSAAGASPLETPLTFAESVLVIMPQYGFPPGETLTLQPQAAGLFRNLAGQPSLASSVAATIEVVEQVQFVQDTDLPKAMFGGAAFVTPENELFLAAGAGASEPVGGVIVARTRRKVNCRIGVSPYSNCLNPCDADAKRKVFERLLTAPSHDGSLCVDAGGMAQYALGSVDRLLADTEEKCICPVCVQGPTVLPPNIDLENPVWETWRSVSSSNVQLGFTCAAGYLHMKDFLCSVGNVSEDRSFEYYGRWSVAEDACQALNCTDASQVPSVAYGSQSGCTESFLRDGKMLHAESCEVFCKAGYEPIPPDEPYITANGTVLPAREIICEFGKIQTAPRCQPQLCTPTPEERPQWDPAGGNMTCSTGKRGEHSLGSKCFIECFPGFSAENDFTGPAKCAVPSYKSNTPEARVKYQQYVACPRMSCGTVREANRATYKGTVVNCTRGDNLYEDACALECDPGHEPKEPEDTSIVCKLTEESNLTEVKWVGGGLAGCRKKLCPTPPPRSFELQKTRIQCPRGDGEQLYFGDACQVECLTNSYSLMGMPSYDGYSGQLRCTVLEDGSVDLNGFPTCVANRCFKKTAPSLNPISTMGCDGDDENTIGNPCWDGSPDPECDGQKDGLRPGESCQVRCEDGYEPVLPDEVVEGPFGDEIVLYCQDGLLQGPMFLAPQRVCKPVGDIVELVQTVKCALTVSGNVDGLGSFTNMRRWAKDTEVRGILKKVISDQISTPDIRFFKKDIDYLDGVRLRRLSLELDLDDWSPEPGSLSPEPAPARELTVGSAKVNFQVLMSGENNEPGSKEKALLSAKTMLELLANDTSPFVGALRQELLTSPNWQTIYPPDLNVMISQPVISVAVVKKGEETPVPTPQPTPEPGPGFYTYAMYTAGSLFCCSFMAMWIRSCNKVGEGKKGKGKGKKARVAPDKEGTAEAEAAKKEEAAKKPSKEAPEEKKGDGGEAPPPEDIEGKGGGDFKVGKKIEKPSEKRGKRLSDEEEEVPETGKPVAEPDAEP